MDKVFTLILIDFLSPHTAIDASLPTNPPPTNPPPTETTQTPILSIALGGTIGGAVLVLILAIVVLSAVCVAKRKSQSQYHPTDDDPTYDYPDELPPPPLPQPRIKIQVTTNTAYGLARLDSDALSHTHETTMGTANPAYGRTLSAEGIPIDTNSAYGMIQDIPITNSAQQQHETAINPN